MARHTPGVPVMVGVAFYMVPMRGDRHLVLTDLFARAVAGAASWGARLWIIWVWNISVTAVAIVTQADEKQKERTDEK